MSRFLRGLPYDRQVAEENCFRYGRVHFDLDSLDSYAVTPDDPDRTTLNPAKKAAAAVVRTARKALADAEAECLDRKPKAIGIPVPSGPQSNA